MTKYTCLEKITYDFNDEQIDKVVFSVKVEWDKYTHHSGWWLPFETLGKKQYQCGVEQYIVWKEVV
ncbi:hypothetical protein [Klebsiella phage 05F01]|nr:hypothetical protein [Klebsiella phage 05F01]